MAHSYFVSIMMRTPSTDAKSFKDKILAIDSALKCATIENFFSVSILYKNLLTAFGEDGKSLLRCAITYYGSQKERNLRLIQEKVQRCARLYGDKDSD